MDPSAHGLADRYLELLKRSLLNELYVENEARVVYAVHAIAEEQVPDPAVLFSIAETTALEAVVSAKRQGDMVSVHGREDLRNLTELSHTMIGRARLDQLHDCMRTVLDAGVPGDFIETGVWRGGATIFMRGFLAAYGVTDRRVWVADSFEGVPPPRLEEDRGMDISADVLPVLAVDLETVQELFERYQLLDEQVHFLKGWFRDTLPTAPIDRIAVLRLDGDLYESTMDGLNALYDRVSPGGFVIVDDFHSCPPCKLATLRFRESRKIADELIPIDSHSVYWIKS